MVVFWLVCGEIPCDIIYIVSHGKIFYRFLAFFYTFLHILCGGKKASALFYCRNPLILLGLRLCDTMYIVSHAALIKYPCTAQYRKALRLFIGESGSHGLWGDCSGDLSKLAATAKQQGTPEKPRAERTHRRHKRTRTIMKRLNTSPMLHAERTTSDTKFASICETLKHAIKTPCGANT